jgi:hypothetical protein
MGDGRRVLPGRLTLRGTATLFGVAASIDATVATRGGDIVVRPNVPLGGFATLTVFSNAHVAVQAVSARPTSDGFTVIARGRLR